MILTSCFMDPSLGMEPHHSALSDSTINTILSTGRTNTWLSILLFLSVEPINNFTFRTKAFSPGKVSITFESFHSICLQLQSFKMTMSSWWKFLIVDDHFAFHVMITRVLYAIDSKIHCLNAALFPIAFWSRYQVD